MASVRALFCFAVCVPLLGQGVSVRVLEDHTGAPLFEAEVQVGQPGAPMLLANLETDRRGLIQLGELAPGEYRIRVEKPNYQPTTTTLRVVSGEPTRPVSTRLIRSATLEGRVTSADGMPVTGAVVRVLPKPASGVPWRVGFFQRRLEGTVGEAGVYRISGIPPGQYGVVLSIGASTHAVGQSGSAVTAKHLGSNFQFYPDDAAPRVFSVAGGEEYRSIDFSVRPQAFRSIQGTVQGNPASGQYWLALTKLDQPGIAIGVTMTNRDGTFALGGIPAGTYQLLAAGPSFSRGIFGGHPEGEARFARMRLDLSAGDVQSVTVEPLKGRTARFQLRPGQGDPQKTDCAAGAEVTIASVEDWGSALESRKTMSWDTLTVPDLAPGPYLITARPRDTACFAEAPQIVDLTAEDKTVSIPLARGGSISGRLEAEDGAPPDFVIMLMPAASSSAVPDLQSARPTANGEFLFPTVPPGRYRLASKRSVGAGNAVIPLEQMFEVEVRGGSATRVNLVVPRTGGQR